MSKTDKEDFICHLELEYQKQQVVNKERKRINKIDFLLRMFKYVGVNNLICQFTVMMSLVIIFAVTNYYPSDNYMIASHFIKVICCSAIIMVSSSFLFLGNSFRYEMIELEKATFFSKKGLLKVHFTIAFLINVLMLSCLFFFFSYLRMISVGEISFYFVFSIELTFLIAMLIFQQSQKHPIDWYLYLGCLTASLLIVVITIPNIWVEELHIFMSPVYLVLMFLGCFYVSVRVLITD